MTMLLFYLAVLFWLVAWAGVVAFTRLPQPAPASSVWNKVCAIACLICGFIAIVFLIADLFHHPLAS
jgi:hypothetical protein